MTIKISRALFWVTLAAIAFPKASSAVGPGFYKYRERVVQQRIAAGLHPDYDIPWGSTVNGLLPYSIHNPSPSFPVGQCGPGGCRQPVYETRTTTSSQCPPAGCTQPAYETRTRQVSSAPAAAQVSDDDENQWDTARSTTEFMEDVELQRHRKYGTIRQRSPVYQTSSGAHTLTDVRKGATRLGQQTWNERELGFQTRTLSCKVQVKLRKADASEKNMWLGIRVAGVRYTGRNKKPPDLWRAYKEFQVVENEPFFENALEVARKHFAEEIRFLPYEIQLDKELSDYRVESYGRIGCFYWGSNVQSEYLLIGELYFNTNDPSPPLSLDDLDANYKVVEKPKKQPMEQPSEPAENGSKVTRVQRKLNAGVPDPSKPAVNFLSYEKALAKAESSQKPLVILIHKYRCPTCARLVTLLKSEGVKALREKVVVGQLEIFTKEQVAEGKVTEERRIQQLELLAGILQLKIPYDELSERLDGLEAPALIAFPDVTNTIFSSAGAKSVISESADLPSDEQSLRKWIESK